MRDTCAAILRTPPDDIEEVVRLAYHAGGLMSDAIRMVDELVQFRTLGQ